MVYLGIITISIFTAILAMIIIILSIGIDSRIALNIDNGFAVSDTFIFKRLFIFKMKILLHNQNLYIKIGKKPYRKFSFYYDKNKSKMVHSLDFPRLKISHLAVKISAGIEGNAYADTVLWGGLELIVGNLMTILNKYVDIRNCESTISPNYTEDSAKLSIDFNIKFSILKLLSYITFKSKSKNKSKISEQ